MKVLVSMWVSHFSHSLMKHKLSNQLCKDVGIKPLKDYEVCVSQKKLWGKIG